MKIEEKIYKRGYLLRSGENCVELVKHDKTGYDFNSFNIRDIKNKKLITELQNRFYKFAKEKKCIIQSENSERDRLQSEFLKNCGFSIKYSKQCFIKDLTKNTSRYHDIFQYRTIYDTGIEKFFNIFRASVDHPIRTLSGFNRYIKRIKKEYNSGGRIDNWNSVFLKGKPIGIIMPYKIWTTVPPEFSKPVEAGTLLNIALIPNERGKGYGRIIHSRGLMILKSMGLKIYLGSTATDNYAMLKVFKMNNCRKTIVQHFYYAK